MTGSSQVYAASVLGAEPQRLLPAGRHRHQQAVDQVKGGTADLQQPSRRACRRPVQRRHGRLVQRHLVLPGAARPGPDHGPEPSTIELWFKTTASDGMLLLADGATRGQRHDRQLRAEPVRRRRRGADRRVRQRQRGRVITSGEPVNDGKWHFVVLSARTSSQDAVPGRPAGGHQDRDERRRDEPGASADAYVGRRLTSAGTGPTSRTLRDSTTTGYRGVLQRVDRRVRRRTAPASAGTGRGRSTPRPRTRRG